MAVQHNLITDPEIHEAKGTSTATNRQVLVADGAGSASWQDTVLSNHAEMSITNNATATAVTAAVDATLNTDTDYTKVTAGWASVHVEGMTFNVDELVATVAGDYRVDFWCSVKVALNNNFIGLKYAVNDTAPYSTQKIKTQSVTINDYRNMFASGIVTLTVGQTISMYVAASKTDSLTFEEAGMQVSLLHEN